MADVEQPALFPQAELDSQATAPALTDVQPTPDAESFRPAPRFNRPERDQGEMFTESLDQRLDADHPARVIWKLVEQLDLSSLYQQIQAVEGGVGRNASDPRVLFALCLYACVEGVSSSRKLAKLCDDHRGFQWLRGGVPVNHHMLSNFFRDHQQLLDQLLTESLAGLLQEGLVELNCAAQDGMRLRASAGKASFRRQATLEESLEEARKQVAGLRAEREAEANGAAATVATARERAARERAAREKEERIVKALEHVKEVAKQREARKKGDGDAARASTTDPEARIMKMPDGGFRPAFNVQFATDTASGIILGVDVINQGTDAGQIEPMMTQTKERLGKVPDQVLIDGGYMAVDDIEKATEAGTTVFMPIKDAKKMLEKGRDPHERKPGDSDIIADWRKRMGTEMAKLIYKLRAQTAELTNAHMRNRGLYSIRVRGLVKVKTMLMWHVLAQNLLRGEVLRAVRATSGGTPCAEVA